MNSYQQERLIWAVIAFGSALAFAIFANIWALPLAFVGVLAILRIAFV